MKKIIGYARVSSKEQAENSHALEQQIERLKSAGAIEVLADVESGWKNSDRPNLQKLIALVENHQVDKVIITRLDRLSRQGLKSFEIINKFLQSDVILKALDESFDLTTAAGRAMAGQLVVFAQFHSDQKAESVRHGWQHLRDKKVAVNPPFGYIIVDNSHQLDYQPFLCLIENQQEMSRAQIARTIIDAFLEEKTLRLTLRKINQFYGIKTFAHNNSQGKKLGGRVARYIFRFSPFGLKNWLTNPVLQGHIAYLRRDKTRTKIYYNTHSEHRLITDEEAKEITKILAHNKRVKGFGSTSLKYPCSGLVFCAECRSACYSLSGANNYYKAKKLGIKPDMNYYFQCKNWRTRSCNQKTIIRMEKVEQAVIKLLKDKAYAIVKSKINITPTIIKSEKLLQLESQLKGLKNLGKNSAIEEAIANIQSQIEEEKKQSHHNSQNYQEIEAKKQLCQQAFSKTGFWESRTDKEKQIIYRELVDKVMIRDGEVVDISLNFS